MKDISEQIESCVISTAWIKPQTEVLDTPEILKIVNEAAPYFFMNGVYRTLLTKNIDERIQNHYDSFRVKKISFRWYVFPHSLPIDLSQKLEKLNPAGSTEMAGLCYDLREQKFPSNSKIRVEELSETNLEDYCRASNEGWNQAGDQAKSIAASIRRDFENGTLYKPFLAYHNGEPASTGMLLIKDDAGYLFGGSTSPKHRGNGVYKALVYHRLQVLRNLKLKRALILARKDTSAPICLRLGFTSAFECRSYEFGSFD